MQSDEQRLNDFASESSGAPGSTVNAYSEFAHDFSETSFDKAYDEGYYFVEVVEANPSETKKAKLPYLGNVFQVLAGPHALAHFSDMLFQSGDKSKDFWVKRLICYARACQLEGVEEKKFMVSQATTLGKQLWIKVKKVAEDEGGVEVFKNKIDLFGFCPPSFQPDPALIRGPMPGEVDWDNAFAEVPVAPMTLTLSLERIATVTETSAPAVSPVAIKGQDQPPWPD